MTTTQADRLLAVNPIAVEVRGKRLCFNVGVWQPGFWWVHRDVTGHRNCKRW